MIIHYLKQTRKLEKAIIPFKPRQLDMIMAFGQVVAGPACNDMLTPLKTE